MRLLIITILILATGVIARAQPAAPLAVDAAAQGHALTIVVFADAPAHLRITLPPGWTGAPREQTVNGLTVLRYELQPGDAVGQGEIVVQAWAGSAYAADRAWVWGRVPEAARAERPGVQWRLAMVKR